MSRMYAFLKHIFPFLALLMVVSCEGAVDGDGSDGPDEVPEGVLRIFADKTSIDADGNDEVTFTVMFGSKDVSNEKTLQLVRKYGSETKYMAYGANKFSTVTAGEYEFSAEYYYGGKHFSDNSVKIEAKQFFSGEEKDYEQRVLGVYFTSTGCTSCPSATKGLKDLNAEYPGKISIVAFHSNMGVVSDPMTIPETEAFNAALGGFDGLPRLFWNMRQGTHLIGPSFNESYKEEIASYRPQCGVSVKTESAGDGKYAVNIGITSNIPAVYRYLVFVVEDGIVADQTGDPDYVHDNVVRAVLTSAGGDKINDNLPLTVGVEAKASETFVPEAGWNVGNMRVVVAAMVSEDGGYNWTANNVAECKLGE